MRQFLTIYITLQSLGLILFFGIAPFLEFKITPEEASGVVQILLPIFTGYIGTIVGWYFAEERDQ